MTQRLAVSCGHTATVAAPQAALGRAWRAMGEQLEQLHTVAGGYRGTGCCAAPEACKFAAVARAGERASLDVQRIVQGQAWDNNGL